MKNVFSLACLLIAGMLASCSATVTEDFPESSEKYADFTLLIKDVNFKIDQTPITRSTKTASEVLKTLDLALYSKQSDGSYHLYDSIQTSSGGTNFGTFSLKNVKFGDYLLVILGNVTSTTHADFSDPEKIAYSDDQVPTCYLYQGTLNVNDSIAKSQDIMLKPGVATFCIRLKDTTPSEVTSFKFELTNATRSYNAVKDVGSEVTEAFSFTKDVTARDNTAYYQANLFLPGKNDLPSTESQVTIKVSALKSDSTALKSYEFTQVPLKRGSITTYNGNFFKVDSQSFNITVDQSWDTSYTGKY